MYFKNFDDDKNYFIQRSHGLPPFFIFVPAQKQIDYDKDYITGWCTTRI